MFLKLSTLIFGAMLAMPALNAQGSFTIKGRQVQFHSFASQGFAYSNQNNYLTMDTSCGSFAMTDVGVNISTQLTDRFRVGAQFYDRNLGKARQFQSTVGLGFRRLQVRRLVQEFAPAK